jgi:CheY-like chemotaxis protein
VTEGVTVSKPGVVVVVTEEEAVRRVLTSTLENEGWVVLALEDGGELFDFMEFMSEHPSVRGVPRLIVADVSVPGPSVFEVAAWARLKGLDVPFVLFTDDRDESSKNLARALGAVELTAAA